MKKILTVSSSATIIDTVKNACKKYSSYFDSDVFSDADQVINYIDYELPEIKVLDFSSDIDGLRILSAINDDPWLHYGGIIAVCKDRKQLAEIEEKKDGNILSILTVADFQRNFSRLLRILYQSQQFLYTRGMQDVIGGQETGSFICGNDPMDIQFYTNFLVSYLYNTNRISEEDRFNLQMTLMELLTNALEHGNLEISYQEKSDWMNKGGDMMQLYRQKSALPEFSARKIKITYEIGKTKSRFIIRDDGKGFDWKKFVNKEEKAEAGTTEFHGRGISLSKDLVTNIYYNDKGNQVTFETENQKNITNTVPGIMKPFVTLEYTDKQVVCRQNEMSNDLFFIVGGRFAVYAGRKLVSVLTPNDMFIGEMAFLLNDRRTATVLAVGNCKLIKIPKGAFLSLIRKNPHYGIFLSKMLAQRLSRQTQATIHLTEHIKELTTTPAGHL